MKTMIKLLFAFLVFVNICYAQYSSNFVGNFNGINSYVSVPNTSNLSPVSSITLEAWIYPTQLGPNTMAVIGKNYQTGYFLGVQSSGRVVFYPKGSAFLRSKVTGTIPLNKWTHIAATYSNSITTIYINGITDTSTSAITGSLTVNSDSLFLGADRVGTQQPNLFFKGRIENIRIWGIARSSTQISENKTLPLEIYAPSGVYTGLRASFQLDGNALNYGGSALEIGNTRNVTFIDHSNKAVNILDYNNSLVLNGTSDYFTVNNYSGFNATGAITLEAWIKRDITGTQPTAQNIVNKSGGSSRYDYALYVLATGELYFEINSGSYSMHTLPLITNSQWTHVAATYNSAANPPYAILYINGQYVTSTVFSGNPLILNNPDNLYIGGIGASSFAANKFKGQIDEVRIWKTERTVAQIKDNMFTDASDINLTDFSFDKNANVIHNGNSTVFAGNAFVGSAKISSSHAFTNNHLTSPVMSGNLLGFSNFSNSYKGFYVPDNNAAGVQDSVFISSDGVITNLKAYVLISHTYTADLILTLISPAGTSLTLINSKGGSGNDIMTIFSDAADSLPSLGTDVNGPGINAPFSTSVKPQQQLSGFNGQNKQGWWKLKCADITGADIGYVHGWGINIASVPLHKTLKLTAIIQGFYNSTSDKMVKDTASVLLKDIDPPYGNLDSATAVLNIFGKGNFTFSNIQIGEFYFIAVKHRNSIETWSSAGYSFTSDTLNYNFTNAATKAYGDNMIQVDVSPVRFAIYNGDVNQNGVVDAVDSGTIDNDAFNFITGYVKTDLTGDNVIDALDQAIAFNNALNFVSKITPP